MSVQEDFNNDLTQISNAIYGKDVRAAMVDAMQLIWDHSGTAAIDTKMDKANPTGTGYVAIGYSASASAIGAVALGSSVTSQGQGSAAIGANLTTYEGVVGQVVVGKNNVAVQDAVFVVGNGAQSSDRNNAFVVTQSGAIHAKNDFVLETTNCKISMMREPNTTAGTYSVALGQKNTASNTHAMAIGYQNGATGVESFAGGYQCHSGHDQSFAFGVALNTARNRQFVIGEYNDSTANALFVVGSGASATQRKNVLEICKKGLGYIGEENSVSFSGTTEEARFSIGYENSIFKNHSYSLGDSADIQTEDSVSIGHNNHSYTSGNKGNNIYMFGHDLVEGKSDKFVIGKYNNDNISNISGNAMLVVGNGYATSGSPVRQNAMIVTDSGNLYIYGHIYCVNNGTVREVALQ